MVSVGAVPAGHFTDEGQVTVRLPVGSCLSARINLPTVPEAGGFENVNVQLALRMRLKEFPLSRSIV